MATSTLISRVSLHSIVLKDSVATIVGSFKLGLRQVFSNVESLILVNNQSITKILSCQNKLICCFS